MGLWVLDVDEIRSLSLAIYIRKGLLDVCITTIASVTLWTFEYDPT